jgi:hypothetical protein
VQVAVCKDADAGRAAAEQIFARYGGLENYQRLLAREGVASSGALAIDATESVVERQPRRCADVGTTELWPTIFPVGDESEASIRRTRALLAALTVEMQLGRTLGFGDG